MNEKSSIRRQRQWWGAKASKRSKVKSVDDLWKLKNLNLRVVWEHFSLLLLHLHIVVFLCCDGVKNIFSFSHSFFVFLTHSNVQQVMNFLLGKILPDIPPNTFTWVFWRALEWGSQRRRVWCQVCFENINWKKSKNMKRAENMKNENEWKKSSETNINIIRH